jgi:hypothetical protein
MIGQMVAYQKTILSRLLEYFVLRIFFSVLIVFILPVVQANAASYTTVPNPPVPSDLKASCDTGNFSSTACKIAEEMIFLSPSDIALYGLGNNDPIVIEQTLELLDNMTLNKVLQSITSEELVILRQKITNQTFDRIIPEPLHERLMNRLSLN